MLDIKQNKWVAALVLLVAASIIYLFVIKQATLQYKMQDAFEGHDHENALIFASTLLEKEPGNQEAISIIKESGQILLYLHLAQSKFPDFRVVKDEGTGQLFFYLHPTQSSTADSVNTADNVMVNAEKVYADFNIARAYTAKAKDLDSEFNTTLNLEKRLEKAQTYVLNILAANVFDAGNSVYKAVAKDYEKKAAVINSASNSEYLDIFLKVQSAWAPVEITTDEVKQNIHPLLDKMDNTGQLVSAYKAGNLTDPLLSYIQVVKESVDTLLIPKGSYKDFMKVASSTTNKYKKAHGKLKRALSGSAKENNFSQLVNAIVDYKLFYHESTLGLIKKNQYLQGV